MNVSFATVSYREPAGYDMNQIGTAAGKTDHLMFMYTPDVELERWFDGPVQMTLNAALISLISMINFYALQGIPVKLDFDNQPISWMNKMYAKEGSTFLEVCIDILKKQGQITCEDKVNIKVCRPLRLP